MNHPSEFMPHMTEFGGQDNNNAWQIPANPPQWMNSPIEFWDTQLAESVAPFVQSHLRSFNGRHLPHPSLIAGGIHKSAITPSNWLSLANTAKTLAPDYDYQADKAPIRYVSLTGHEWYSSDALLNICLAKLFPYSCLASQFPVQIDDYRVDWVMYEIFQDWANLLRQAKTDLQITPRKELIRQIAVAGWHLHTYRLSLMLSLDNDHIVLDSHSAKTLLNRCSCPGWQTLLINAIRRK